MVLFEVKMIIIDEKWDNKGEKIHVLSVFCILQTLQTTFISTFKTDTTILGIVFSISNFFINTISQGRN